MTTPQRTSSNLPLPAIDSYICRNSTPKKIRRSERLKFSASRIPRVGCTPRSCVLSDSAISNIKTKPAKVKLASVFAKFVSRPKRLFSKPPDIKNLLPAFETITLSETIDLSETVNTTPPHCSWLDSHSNSECAHCSWLDSLVESEHS